MKSSRKSEATKAPRKDDDPKPEVVFDVDTTKLLSGESFVVANIHRSRSPRPFQDPAAPHDVCELIDVLCNDTSIGYKKPKEPDRRPGPLQAAWLEVSREPPRTHESAISDALGETAIERDMRAESRPFFNWLCVTQDSSIIAKWVEFQVSDPHLQELFWDNNKEERLEQARDCLSKSLGGPRTQELAQSLGSSGKDLIGYASNNLRGAWDNGSFGLAYAYWAYIKGVWHARSLGDDRLYVRHWLRQRAAAYGDQTTRGKIDLAALPVPWGCLVRSLISRWPKEADIDGLAKALLKLRGFSKDKFPDARTKASRAKFLRDGLDQVLETVGARTRPSAPFRLIAFAAETAAVLAGSGSAAYVMSKLERLPPGLERHQRIRLLIKRNRPHLQRFLQTGRR